MVVHSNGRESVGGWGDGGMGRWGDGEIERLRDGEIGRWGDWGIGSVGEIKKYISSTITMQDYRIIWGQNAHSYLLAPKPFLLSPVSCLLLLRKKTFSANPN
ncbi:MAG: hypothetical protein F6K54_20090 [Okeania sp. SIO3B5]|uniref:hypothetical protein n=1 Tax=Okeania sp. SIO3B5 TaxID=2607811 RepID=UPI0013FEF02D|nr:hypothetical protein [Okeania sp. SIO3B5]NEO55174.1 hypothetical protein [Okeania sp. SIO3B5]